MVSGRFYFDALQPPAVALSRGQGLLDALGPEQPVALYGAELDSAGVVLGAYQNVGQALRAEAFEAIALPVVRRKTGGAAVFSAPGVLYAALALQHASVLMACPPGRILNRNIRGLLAGIRALGVPAYYFGRDFVTAAAEPCAYVGWSERDDGRVLLEFFISVETSFSLPPELDGYPQRKEPPLRGKTPTTLRDAGVQGTASSALTSIATGYEETHGLAFEQARLSHEALATAAHLGASLRVEVSNDRSLHWSHPREEAIGFVSAGVDVATDERLSALELCGDFFQHSACPHQLETRLLGQVPTPEVIGAALDAVYGTRPGLIEGVRSLNTLRDAITDAVSLAQS